MPGVHLRLGINMLRTILYQQEQYHTTPKYFSIFPNSMYICVSGQLICWFLENVCFKLRCAYVALGSISLHGHGLHRQGPVHVCNVPRLPWACTNRFCPATCSESWGQAAHLMQRKQTSCIFVGPRRCSYI